MKFSFLVLATATWAVLFLSGLKVCASMEAMDRWSGVVGLRAGPTPFEFFPVTPVFKCSRRCVREMACSYQTYPEVEFFAVYNLTAPPRAVRFPIKITDLPPQVVRASDTLPGASSPKETASPSNNFTCPDRVFPFLPQAMIVSLVSVANATDQWFQIEAPFRQTTCADEQECVVGLAWAAEKTGYAALIPPCVRLGGNYCNT